MMQWLVCTLLTLALASSPVSSKGSEARFLQSQPNETGADAVLRGRLPRLRLSRAEPRSSSLAELPGCSCPTLAATQHHAASPLLSALTLVLRVSAPLSC